LFSILEVTFASPIKTGNGNPLAQLQATSVQEGSEILSALITIGNNDQDFVKDPFLAKRVPIHVAASLAIDTSAPVPSLSIVVHRNVPRHSQDEFGSFNNGRQVSISPTFYNFTSSF
jgi:hypothetical protein